MRRLARTVPTSFIRLDSAVTSQDRFLNVRDMQVARLNHNKLVGFTGIRCAYHCQLGAGPTAYSSFINPGLTGIGSAISSPPIIRTRVLLTPNVRTVKVYADAQATKVGIRLYYVLSHPGVERQPDTAESLYYTAAFGGVFNTTVTVPPGGIRRFQWREFDFAAYVNPVEVGPVRNATVAISAATTTSVTVATASISALVQRGDLMYFDTAAGVQPYPGPRVISSTSISGANTILHTLWPWGSDVPVPGTHRVTVRDMSALELTSLTMIEEPTTYFDAYRGLYS